MFNICGIFFAVLLFQMTFASAPTDVLFLISGQDSSSYHRQLNENIRKNIQQQALNLTTNYKIRVYMLNELFSNPGDWTLLTILSRLYDAQFTPPLINEDTKWIILCEESTHVALKPLLNILVKENYNETTYLGFPLYDQEATIIHHFAFFENPKWFPYPMLRAGLIFTVSLLKSLATAVSYQGAIAGTKLPTRTTDFSIDAAHELSRFILNNIRIERDIYLQDAAAKRQASSNLSEKILPTSFLASLETTTKEFHFKNVRKIILKRASYICPKAPTGSKSISNSINTVATNDKVDAACIMYAKPMDTASCLPIKRTQIFFAIKTCHKFHMERIPIIEATWGPYVAHKRYYSDITDTTIPTIDTGVPNTETGHCSKTLAILKLALKEIEQMNRELKSTRGSNNVEAIHWLMLSDDDTLLSVSHLCNLLGCFNHTEMVYLGERYGYRLHAEDGFNYITGGGGIVFSLPVIKLILKHCTCPTLTSPDDMILGSCLHMLNIKAIHSSRFHQARPNDYATELLQLEPPISFHKFWQHDPLQVYEKWFSLADRQMLSLEILQNKSYNQNLKLRMHLKEIAATKNKSQFARGSTASCSSHNKNVKNFKTKMDTSDQLPFSMEATLQHESKSHLDL